MRSENELALLRAETRMVGLICGVKLADKVACEELRDRLGLEDVVKVLQHNRLSWDVQSCVTWFPLYFAIEIQGLFKDPEVAFSRTNSFMNW